MNETRCTVVSKIVDAPREAVYQALLDPQALAQWLPPQDMRGQVHALDARVGGEIRMSLTYLDQAAAPRGKTSAATDTFRGRFVQLVPGERIVWAVQFESADPSFAGEMTVSWTLVPTQDGTEVTVRCDQIPPGIRLEDNEAGSRSTLEKLASYLDR